MNALVPKNADHVIGVLSGWDRLVFRGTLRMLAFAGGMAAYLSRIGTLLKDFGDHAQAMTEQLIQASLKRAEVGRAGPSNTCNRPAFARTITPGGSPRMTASPTA